jgi:hypothetical protein
MSSRAPQPALHKTEAIQKSPGSRLDRIRVEAGWLYRATEWDSDNGGGYAVALSFVPDPPVRT